MKVTWVVFFTTVALVCLLALAATCSRPDPNREFTRLPTPVATP